MKYIDKYLLGTRYPIGNTTLEAYNPCAVSNDEIKPEFKKCCELLDENIKEIDSHEIST